MIKDKSIRVPVTLEEREQIKDIAFKHGYRSTADFLRDKATGLLESDEIKTLKAKNKKLMQFIKDGE